MSQILITADRVLEGSGLERKENTGLLMDGGKIAEIAPAAVLRERYPQAETCDYGDATILPGLIDSHNHLDWDCNVPNYVAISQECEARLAILGMNDMQSDLRSGVTSSRYMGGHFFLDVNFRDYQRAGIVKGPKMQASGVGLRSSAGHGYLGVAADGEDQVIAGVRKNLLRGIDWMKFYSTGSHLNAKGFPSSFYTKHEVSLIIDMAHRVGIPVTSHCVGGQGMIDAIDCGIDCLEHCYFIEDENIEKMLKAGTWACLTMSEYFTEKPNMPASMAVKFDKYRDIVHQRMQAIIASGVPYVLGTDGMHGHLWEEAVYLTQHGGTAIQALKALTIDAAKLMGIDESTGSLDSGKCADIVVVEGDPLQDVACLGKVKAVYQDGIRV